MAVPAGPRLLGRSFVVALESDVANDGNVRSFV